MYRSSQIPIQEGHLRRGLSLIKVNRSKYLGCYSFAYQHSFKKLYKQHIEAHQSSWCSILVMLLEHTTGSLAKLYSSDSKLDYSELQDTEN